MIKQFLKKDIVPLMNCFCSIFIIKNFFIKGAIKCAQFFLIKEQCSNYLNKIKKNVAKISFLILMIYIIIIIFLYRYYNSKIEIEKTQILQNHYEKIVAVSLNKINSLALQAQCSLEDNNTSIRINNSDIQVCCNRACKNYRVFRFGSLLDQYIPDFIYYKIEINKKFVYANTRIQQYQIDKTYHLNESNHLNVSLDINNIFWHQREVDIREPLWLIITITSTTFLLLFFLNKTIIKNFNKGYNLYYQDIYQVKLEKIEMNYQHEIENCKEKLMNKIWNLDFYKQKDLEINCLFAQAANQIAYSGDTNSEQKTMLKDFRFKNYGNKVPCSILLYQNNGIEEINVTKFTEMFTARFGQEDDNISLIISSGERIIRFVSQAALYQIIYSLISYLFFLLRKQTPTVKYHIALVVKNIGNRLLLKFEYNGFSVKDETELLRMEDSFFKIHANPFILNLSQVFNVLRSNGFNCIINYDQFNIIDIIQQEINSDQEPEMLENNIISISPFIEKNK